MPAPFLDVPVRSSRPAARRTAAALVAVWFAVPCGLAQAQQVAWWTHDSGGAASNGGGYRLAGTAGQADPGAPLGGGDFELRGGYWVGARDLGLLLFDDGFETGATARWSALATSPFAPPTVDSGTVPPTLLLLQPSTPSPRRPGDEPGDGEEPQGQPAEIPALDRAGVLLLAVLLAAVGAFVLRRRRAALADSPSPSRRETR